MVKIISNEKYKNLIKGFDEYHLAQSAEWEEFQAVNFKHHKIFAYYRGNEAVIIGRIVSSRILKFFKVVQCNYGPLVKSNVTSEEFNNFLELFKKELMSDDDIFAQFSPVSFNIEHNQFLADLLSKSELKKSPKALRRLSSTIFMDIEFKTIEEELESFRKDIKTNIKKYINNPNLIEVSISQSDEDFKIYWENFEKVWKEKQFEDIGYNLYKKLIDSKRGTVFLIKKEGKILSGGFIIHYPDQNTAIIISSFNHPEGLELKTPSVLRWEILKWAKREKFRRIDFFDGGSTKGIRDFKLGFSKDLIEYAPCYDLVKNKLLYRLALAKVV